MQFLSRILGYAFQPTLRYSDGLATLVGALVPVIYSAMGYPMPEEPATVVGLWVAAAIGIVLTMRLAIAPYFIWREDQAEIARLQQMVQSPKHREREKIAEIMAQQRIMAAEEVSRIRRAMLDELASKDEKKIAFHGAEKYSDKF